MFTVRWTDGSVERRIRVMPRKKVSAVEDLRHPALLVAIIDPGAELDIPIEVVRRYDSAIIWSVADVDMPFKDEPARSWLLAWLKIFRTVFLSKSRDDSFKFSEAIDFVTLLGKAIEKSGGTHSFVDVTVACSMGLSRSPATAALVARALGAPHVDLAIRKHFETTYNRMIYVALRKVWEDSIAAGIFPIPYNAAVTLTGLDFQEEVAAVS